MIRIGQGIDAHADATAQGGYSAELTKRTYSRLAELARRHEVTLTPGADATAGRLEKSMGDGGGKRV